MLGVSNRPVVPSPDNDQNEGESIGAPRAGMVADPLQLFFARWWRQLGLLALALTVVAYAYGIFRQTFEDSMRSSADLFARVRSEYRQISEARQSLRALGPVSEASEKSSEKTSDKGGEKTTANTKDSSAKKSGAKSNNATPDAEKSDTVAQRAALEKQITESSTRINEQLGALANSREPYQTLGAFYGALVKADAGDLSELRGLVQRSEAGGVDQSPQLRLAGELATLALARSLLDDGKTLDEGRRLLLRLIERGEETAVSAASTLALIAENPEQCAETLAAVQSLQQRAPEQADLLEGPLKRLEACAAM